MKKQYKNLKFSKYEKTGVCSTCNGTGIMPFPYKPEECSECKGSGKDYPDLKTGDVIKLNNGKILLIGDVNKFIGVCDDCVYCEHEDIIEIANIFEDYK